MNLDYLLAAVMLILANALFVAAEFSLVSLRRTKIQALIRAGDKSAERVQQMLGSLNEYLATCQVGITIASLALGWIGEKAFAVFIAPLFAWVGFGPEGATFSAHAAAVVAAFMIITFLHVVLGEQVPKIVTIEAPETMARWIALPLRGFHALFRPLTWVLHHATQTVIRALGMKPEALHKRVPSQEELALILDESRIAGIVSPDQRRMLARVFRFHDKVAKEIMVPRPDIVAVSLRASQKELVRGFFDSGYSRLPVYDGTLDKIVGIVYVKDIYYALEHPALIKLVDLLREAPEVPGTYKVAQLLTDFQRRRVHMAIVVDEFGVTAGLLTLEDIVEEIVGEIRDEHDQEPDEIERRADGTVLIEARVDLFRFKETFPECEMPRGDFDSVAGLVLHLAGRLPREGESFRLGDLSIRVVKREGRRIRKVAVRRIPPGGTAGPGVLPAVVEPSSGEPLGSHAGPPAAGGEPHAAGGESHGAGGEPHAPPARTGGETAPPGAAGGSRRPTPPEGHCPSTPGRDA